MYVNTPVYSRPMARTSARPARRQSDRRILLDLIRGLREKAKLLQSDVAARLGITQSHYSKYERGDRRIDLLDLLDLCDAIGVSLEDFVRQFQERRRRARV